MRTIPKNQCKANTKQGTRCKNPSIFEGMCVTHYGMKHNMHIYKQKYRKVYWQKDDEYRYDTF